MSRGLHATARVAALGLAILACVAARASAATTRFTAAELSRDLIYACAAKARDAVAAFETDGALAEYRTDSRAMPHARAKLAVAVEAESVAEFFLKEKLSAHELARQLELYRHDVQRDAVKGADTRYPLLQFCIIQRLLKVRQGAPLLAGPVKTFGTRRSHD